MNGKLQAYALDIKYASFYLNSDASSVHGRHHEMLFLLRDCRLLCKDIATIISHAN